MDYLVNQDGVVLQFEKIEKKLTKHDEDITLIFQYLKKLLFHLDLISSPKDYVEILDGIIPTCAGFFGIEKHFGLNTGIIGINSSTSSTPGKHWIQKKLIQEYSHSSLLQMKSIATRSSNFACLIPVFTDRQVPLLPLKEQEATFVIRLASHCKKNNVAAPMALFHRRKSCNGMRLKYAAFKK